jgi:hypothetical protein
MAKLEKRTAARTLYMTGKYELGEIATMLGVSNGSISKWNKDEGWSEEFDRDTKIVNDSEASIRELIHYNLTILKAKARAARKALDDGDLDDASQMELITGKDIDGLSKLYAQIKRKDLEFADKVIIISDFLSFSASKRPELFDSIQQLTDGFIEKISYKK